MDMKELILVFGLLLCQSSFAEQKIELPLEGCLSMEGQYAPEVSDKRKDLLIAFQYQGDLVIEISLKSRFSFTVPADNAKCFRLENGKLLLVMVHWIEFGDGSALIQFDLKFEEKTQKLRELITQDGDAPFERTYEKVAEATVSKKRRSSPSQDSSSDFGQSSHSGLYATDDDNNNNNSNSNQPATRKLAKKQRGRAIYDASLRLQQLGKAADQAYDIGEEFGNVEKYHEAIENYTRMEILIFDSQGINLREQLANVYFNMALSYEGLFDKNGTYNNLENSIVYVTKALKIYKELNPEKHFTATQDMLERLNEKKAKTLKSR